MDDRPGRVFELLTLQKLAALLLGADESLRWRLVAEFLEEYRWESVDSRFPLLEAEPPSGHVPPCGVTGRRVVLALAGAG